MIFFLGERKAKKVSVIWEEVGQKARLNKTWLMEKLTNQILNSADVYTVVWTMLSLPKYTVSSAFAASLVTYHAFSTREQCVFNFSLTI